MMSLDQAVSIPAAVMVRVVDGEAVLLNLDNESYYGLDAVSTQVWTAITECETLQDAVDRLQSTFDVEPEQLVSDVSTFVTDLIASGLINAG